MSAVRPSVYAADNVMERQLAPGDTMLQGESALAGAISTAGAGTWTGAAIATGIIKRTGPTAGFTDTTDTAANIITALAGNAPNVDILPGSTFRLLVRNTVAYALTFAAGTGVVSGDGTLGISASDWREYLVTILNTCAQQVWSCNTTNGSAVVTFSLALNQVSIPFQGSNGQPGTLSNLVGATVTGTGIPAGTTVIGVTQGQGGVTGVTLSANATATNTNVALTFGPTVKFDGLREGTIC